MRLRTPQAMRLPLKRVILPMDGIADVVQIPCHIGQLRNPRIVPQMIEHVFGNIADKTGMTLAVFRVSQRLHGGICCLQEGDNLRITAQVFDRD